MVSLTELIEGDVHCVEDSNNLHGPEPRAHGREADHVREKKTDQVKFLTGVDGCLSVTKSVGNWLGDHLVEEFISSLDVLLQLRAVDSFLWGRGKKRRKGGREKRREGGREERREEGEGEEEGRGGGRRGGKRGREKKRREGRKEGEEKKEWMI